MTKRPMCPDWFAKDLEAIVYFWQKRLHTHVTVPEKFMHSRLIFRVTAYTVLLDPCYLFAASLPGGAVVRIASICENRINNRRR